MPSSDIIQTSAQDNGVNEALAVLQENHLYEYSMATLKAQERDREAERAHSQKTQKFAMIFLMVIAVLLFSGVIAAFYFDKEQFIVECAKYLAVGGGGCGAGYVWGYRKGRRSE